MKKVLPLLALVLALCCLVGCKNSDPLDQEAIEEFGTTVVEETVQKTTAYDGSIDVSTTKEQVFSSTSSTTTTTTTTTTTKPTTTKPTTTKKATTTKAKTTKPKTTKPKTTKPSTTKATTAKFSTTTSINNPTENINE